MRASSALSRVFVNPNDAWSARMPADQAVLAIPLADLPDFDSPVALHGARLASSPCTGVNDDLWIIAVIMVYEN